LFYGPPGTGKSSLCQGLAQKISIRLNLSYKRTKFIQIKTATLLSKFYSQSAKQVDEIFTAIEEICEEDPEQFVCVLIDEVESIANSRESSMQGEVQDSLRATNALLTGLDRSRKYSNVIFLCTSNMPTCLDAAFLDRCGLKFEVNPPGPAIQYEILRGRIQRLIDDGHIISEIPLPSYRDAELEFDTDKRLPGSRLLCIIELINSPNSALEGKISGRVLTQLPGKAVLRYLEEDECDLEMAFKFMEKSVLAERRQGLQKVGSVDEVDDSSPVEREITEPRGQKRKNMRTPKDEWEIDRAQAVLEIIETLVDTVFPGSRSLKRRSN
jgi:MoxR-like ATPase